jgi:HK97 family phage portal protein
MTAPAPAVPRTRDRARLALRSIATNILRATDGRDVLLNSPDGWEVEQPHLWWTGPAGGGGGGPFGNPIPGAGLGATFGQIPAVARATSLIVDTLAASCPWHVYRGDTERLATPDWIADPQALRLDGRVVDPADVHETRIARPDFWGQWILSAVWRGDGFVYAPTRDAYGAPKPPLWVLHPDDVQLTDGRYWVGEIELDAGSIMHLRGDLPLVDGRGMGKLDRFAADLATSVAVRDYTAQSFAAGVPAGYLKTSAPKLDQPAADDLKAKWIAAHGGGRRSIAVLNATTEFHPLTWSPVDLAAVDFSRISMGQVALIFGVPAYLLGAPTDANTYANVENRMLELYQLTLLPWIGKIEAVLDAQLPRGTESRIEVDGLLRADVRTRFDTYKIATEQGILTVDEIRALEARPPLGGI